MRLKTIAKLAECGVNLLVIDVGEALRYPVPCGTNWVDHKRRALGMDADEVMGLVVKLVREHVKSERMLGFMMAPWARCSPETKEKNMRGTVIVRTVISFSACVALWPVV